MATRHPTLALQASLSRNFVRKSWDCWGRTAEADMGRDRKGRHAVRKGKKKGSQAADTKGKTIKNKEEQRGSDGEIGSMLCVTRGLSERREENINATQRLSLSKDKNQDEGCGCWERVSNNSNKMKQISIFIICFS